MDAIYNDFCLSINGTQMQHYKWNIWVSRTFIKKSTLCSIFKTFYIMDMEPLYHVLSSVCIMFSIFKRFFPKKNKKLWFFNGIIQGTIHDIFVFRSISSINTGNAVYVEKNIARTNEMSKWSIKGTRWALTVCRRGQQGQSSRACSGRLDRTGGFELFFFTGRNHWRKFSVSCG